MEKHLPATLVLFISFLINVTVAQPWTEQTNPLGFGGDAMVGKIHFVSQTEGWIACGKGGFLHTTDGGTNWTVVNPFPADTVESSSDPSVSMSWVGTTLGWNIGTIGSFDNPQGAVVYKTTNGGSSWSKVTITNELGWGGFQLQFVDVNNGWALTFNASTGTVNFARTTDGGNSWNTTQGMGIFYFVDVNNGWAYASTGPTYNDPPFKIYRTTNGGTDWGEQFTDNSPGEYRAIRFTDLNNGWMVGKNGKVLKTTNGGLNWDFVLNSGINPLASCKTVFALDANNVWISSKLDDIEQTPYVQYTNDGGLNWSTQMTPFGSTEGSNAIFSIYFVDPQTGWLTADNGRIAKYTGTTSVDNNVDGVFSFSVGQNYPNPFNPSTIIEFHIANSGFVSLKVFDVLGNEVTTLVNEVKSAGEYEVEFNAANLSSGIYLYKLQSGNFSQTRKMTLIR